MNADPYSAGIFPTSYVEIIPEGEVGSLRWDHPFLRLFFRQCLSNLN